MKKAFLRLWRSLRPLFLSPAVLICAIGSFAVALVMFFMLTPPPEENAARTAEERRTANEAALSEARRAAEADPSPERERQLALYQTAVEFDLDLQSEFSFALASARAECLLQNKPTDQWDTLCRTRDAEAYLAHYRARLEADPTLDEKIIDQEITVTRLRFSLTADNTPLTAGENYALRTLRTLFDGLTSNRETLRLAREGDPLSEEDRALYLHLAEYQIASLLSGKTPAVPANFETLSFGCSLGAWLLFGALLFLFCREGNEEGLPLSRQSLAALCLVSAALFLLLWLLLTAACAIADPTMLVSVATRSDSLFFPFAVFVMLLSSFAPLMFLLPLARHFAARSQKANRCALIVLTLSVILSFGIRACLFTAPQSLLSSALFSHASLTGGFFPLLDRYTPSSPIPLSALLFDLALFAAAFLRFPKRKA